MIVQVQNREEQWIANIETIHFRHLWKLNGEDYLTFQTTSPILEENFRIMYQDKRNLEWHEFIITEPVTMHEENGSIMYEVYAENSFYETIGDFVEDRRPTNTTGGAALMTALEPSRWEIGRVDDLGINSTNFYRESVKSAVQSKIVPTWKAEFQTRIEVEGKRVLTRRVDLLKQIGRNAGKRFVYDKDMTYIKRTVDMSNFCTALYGFGKGEEMESGGFGRRIDFAEINNGKAYVENEQARLKYGRMQGSSKVHIFGKEEFDDITDKQELLSASKKVLDARSKPRITYDCKVIDLGKDFENVDRGDTVIIKDEDLDITVFARVVEMEVTEDEIFVKIGDYQPNITDVISQTENYISSFRDKSGIWDRADIIKEGGIDASYLSNLVDELNKVMNERGGYVYVSEDGTGLTTYNRPLDQNPTMAIQILGGSFRIANSKNADGTWAWTTFGDGNGFVADYIVSGMLKGGNVKFNLSDGTLLIGRNTTDYQLYFDGTNLHIPGKLLIEEINGQNLKLDGKNITLNGSTTVDGSFKVNGASIFDTVDAQIVRIKNQDLSEFVRGFLSTPTFSTGFGTSQTHLKGSSVAVGTNSQYITLRDTGGRGEFLVQGTSGAYGSGYFYEMNAGGVAGGTSRSNTTRMISAGTNGVVIADQLGSTVLRFYNGDMYYQGRKIVLNTDNTGIHYE